MGGLRSRRRGETDQKKSISSGLIRSHQIHFRQRNRYRVLAYTQMLRRLSLVVLLAGLVAACQNTIESVLQRTPEDLDRLEVELTKYKLKPFPVSIDNEKSLVGGFDLASQAVCRAGPYYAVETPGPSERTSDANYAVSFGWRDAAPVGRPFDSMR